MGLKQAWQLLEESELGEGWEALINGGCLLDAVDIVFFGLGGFRGEELWEASCKEERDKSAG